MSAPATLAATQAALWAQLRLVVIDVETTMADDGLHVVEVAVVTCRAGRRTSTWVTRVNPGVAVDARSQAVHGITDEDLADEPTFAAVAPELVRRLRGVEGETVVVVAHNAGFDVSVLRREFARARLQDDLADLPDLPLLDTRVLPRHVGVRPVSGRLADLVAALSVPHLGAHSAAGDAEATAEAVIALLERAATAGQRDFDALHAAVMGSRSRTRAVRPASTKRPRDDGEPGPAVVLPTSHTTGHAEVLTDASPSAVAAWRAQLVECATLRCPYALDRAAVAEVDPAAVRTAVEAVLAHLLQQAEPDVPAVATVLGALAPLLATLPDRRAALRWFDTWQPRLAAVGRCPRDAKDCVACPDCRTGSPCPLDTWPRDLAVPARGNVTASSRKSFLNVSGVDVGRGVLTSWLKAGRRPLADAVAWLVYQEHRQAGQTSHATALARYAHRAGATEPRLVAAHATLVATPGDADALRRGVALCEEAFLSRQGSTDDAWTELAAKRGQLLGRLGRLAERNATDLDADGNPVPTRRHQSTAPRRARQRRFTVSPGLPADGPVG